MKFQEFRKIPRLNREVVVSEKIDGTNSQVFILAKDKLVQDMTGDFAGYGDLIIAENDTQIMFAGSRTRWITPEQDNHGFARYVKENSEELFKLGEGYHFGEFWGSGIQRGYGLPKGEKRFSLFNVSKWSDDAVRPKCCYVVPVLYKGLFDTNSIKATLEDLKKHGSYATPFMNPEGICIYHTASGGYFKVTVEGDEKGKVAIK